MAADVQVEAELQAVSHKFARLHGKGPDLLLDLYGRSLGPPPSSSAPRLPSHQRRASSQRGTRIRCDDALWLHLGWSLLSSLTCEPLIVAEQCMVIGVDCPGHPCAPRFHLKPLGHMDSSADVRTAAHCSCTDPWPMSDACIMQVSPAGQSGWAVSAPVPRLWGGHAPLLVCQCKLLQGRYHAC